MTTFLQTPLGWLVGGIAVLLVVASAIGAMLQRHTRSAGAHATVANINARIRAWWVMAILFTLSLLVGPAGSILLFSLVSLLALREFVTLAPTRLADHRTLFWSFFIFTPVQYYLVWTGWYGLFSILIPVFAFIILSARTALAGDTERFLERSSTVQWGLMTCVYFVSHVPALLTLRFADSPSQGPQLLFFLVVVVQLSDVLQYIWGKTLGRRPIAPSLSPNKTWEGFLGGVASATLLGAALWWATPFPPLVAAGMSLLATLMGFTGGLIMSAIKRDRGVKDYGALIGGHGGVLDRIDSLCFSAPVFFHLTRYFYAT
jgi:phosphatidate cytidylyltransferase